MEVFKGRPLQNLQLHQPLNLNPSAGLTKSSVTVSSDYSLRHTKSSLSAKIGEVTSSLHPSLDGTVLKKTKLTNDSLRKSDLRLSNKYLANLSILKGFKTSYDFDKTKTNQSTSTTDQGSQQQKSSLLKGWHVVLDLDNSKTSFQERLWLKTELLSHGGVIGFSVNKKTSHLLVDGIKKRSYSFKRNCAQKYGVDVVTVDYIRDCLESGSVLDVKPYIAADRVVETENKENTLLSGKIKTFGKQRASLTEKPEKGSGEDQKLKSILWEDFSHREDYQIAKFCCLKDTKNEGKCLQLELHVLTESVERRFRIYCWYWHEKNMNSSEKCFSVSSSLQAVSLFCKILKSLKGSYSVADVKSEKVGSRKFQEMQMERDLIREPHKLNESVKTLVDIVWKEAIGSASASVNITSVTMEKVNKAVVTLAQIKQMLIEGGESKSQLPDKSAQFYNQICHKGTADVINTRRKLNQMQELCTLLQDVMSVQEASNWKKDVSIINKYRSLRCQIGSVDKKQFKTVMKTIGKEAVENSRIRVANIYSLARPLEGCMFAPKGRKVTSLVHATRPTSLLGILSRGLLLPKTVQEDVGIERRDFGFLGQGIYFGDDIRSNIHFTEPNQCTRTRYLLMCEVIVGKQYKTWQHQPDFVSPPSGYDSVLGVKDSGGNHSMFQHNEYTIYDVGQQRLSYLIEFVQVDETPVVYQPEFSIKDTEEPSDTEKSTEIDVSDVMDISDPMDKVTPGLQTSGGQPVLLERVSVKAKMMDLVAQVTVFQRYRNTNTKPIEAKYVFPLDDTAAVCGFEAFIGDKHIVGEVKEKETAHKEYREAVSQGHGAYLMDEESVDVFTVSVGNLPPSTEVIIKIIYVVELSLDDDEIVFHLPGSLASWRKEGALAEETQNVTSTVATGDNENIKFEMSLSMEMPFDIQTIKCTTHSVKIKRTAAKACITLAEGEDCLREGFHLSVKLHKIHQPHMWVEQNPKDKDSQACMLTFYPEFEVPQLKKPDVTIILDCSNSMKGGSFDHAKKLCYMIASLMPKTYTVNIIKFGTGFTELYHVSRQCSDVDFYELQQFLAKAFPVEGNTDVWRPLHSHYLLEGEGMRNIFIISDGHVSSEVETLKSIAKNSSHTRIFTFGVSTTCNKHMLKTMARSGAGSFEFFDGKKKSAWERKVKKQLQRAGQPSVTSLSVKWHQFDNYAAKPRQAPRHLGALFSGSRLVVFGFVPYCTSATLTAIIDGQEISTIVSTSELCITQGLTLHRLTARALIRDWEDGMLDEDRIKEEIAKEKEKQDIISLSRQYSIVTSLTSFVAIEKRDKHEVQKKPNMEEKLQELLKMEDVDVLPYMDWQLTQEVTLDLDDKDKWEYELEQDEDGITDEMASSSDESIVENLLPLSAEFSDDHSITEALFGSSTSSKSEDEDDNSSSSSSDSRELTPPISHAKGRATLALDRLGMLKSADSDSDWSEEGKGLVLSERIYAMAADSYEAEDLDEEESDEEMGAGLFAGDIFEDTVEFKKSKPVQKAVREQDQPMVRGDQLRSVLMGMPAKSSTPQLPMSSRVAAVPVVGGGPPPPPRPPPEVAPPAVGRFGDKADLKGKLPDSSASVQSAPVSLVSFMQADSKAKHTKMPPPPPPTTTSTPPPRRRVKATAPARGRPRQAVRDVELLQGSADLMSRGGGPPPPSPPLLSGVTRGKDVAPSEVGRRSRKAHAFMEPHASQELLSELIHLGMSPPPPPPLPPGDSAPPPPPAGGAVLPPLPPPGGVAHLSPPRPRPHGGTALLATSQITGGLAQSMNKKQMEVLKHKPQRLESDSASDQSGKAPPTQPLQSQPPAVRKSVTLKSQGLGQKVVLTSRASPSSQLGELLSMPRSLRSSLSQPRRSSQVGGGPLPPPTPPQPQPQKYSGLFGSVQHDMDDTIQYRAMGSTRSMSKRAQKLDDLLKQSDALSVQETTFHKTASVPDEPRQKETTLKKGRRARSRNSIPISRGRQLDAQPSAVEKEKDVVHSTESPTRVTSDDIYMAMSSAEPAGSSHRGVDWRSVSMGQAQGCGAAKPAPESGATPQSSFAFRRTALFGQDTREERFFSHGSSTQTTEPLCGSSAITFGSFSFVEQNQQSVAHKYSERFHAADFMSIGEEERLGHTKAKTSEQMRAGVGGEIKETIPSKTEETFTDEPGFDMKFELFKVPQLRKVTSQILIAATKLCRRMHGKCFAKHEEVLEFLGIPEKTFLEFFRHMGIYSLGPAAADAFLTFITTWLVYVFIVHARKTLPKTTILQSSSTTESLAQMESWLNQQESLYNVKDYYLGQSSWKEVAVRMLGLQNVGS